MSGNAADDAAGLIRRAAQAAWGNDSVVGSKPQAMQQVFSLDFRCQSYHSANSLVGVLSQSLHTSPASTGAPRPKRGRLVENA
jgi:hypothetical protein